MSFLGSRTDAAQFASDTILNLKSDSQLTMIITPATSADFYVSIATNLSSEDIVKALGQACLDQHTNIF